MENDVGRGKIKTVTGTNLTKNLNLYQSRFFTMFIYQLKYFVCNSFENGVETMEIMDAMDTFSPNFGHNGLYDTP